MLFLDSDQLSLADIRAASGLDDKELRRTLQSLACGKERQVAEGLAWVRTPRTQNLGIARWCLLSFTPSYTYH